MKAAAFLLAVCVPAWAELVSGERAALDGDFRTAISELRPLADAGVHEAQVWVGAIYFTHGDYPQAMQWLRMTAEEGHWVSQVFLALAYEGGKGVQKSYIEAYKWLVLAASKDDRASSLRFGLALQMSAAEIAEGERRAQAWKRQPLLFVPRPRVGPVIHRKPRGGA